MNPFRNILRLAMGDFFAKSLNFVAFVYLARVLGVVGYGVLEFAISILTYFLLLADGGLELWATREAAQGKSDIRKLAEVVMPLRIVLAIAAFSALMIMLPVLPRYPGLKMILLFFGITLFAQAANLKWVFMGEERMGRVATGLVLARIVFTAGVFVFVRSPAKIVWVPAMWLAGDLVMAAYFFRIFARDYGALRPVFKLSGAGKVLRPALTMGASHGLSLVSYNFDSVLLGFLLTSAAVGLYNAAYKPVTIVLAIPVTYFLGLFPALSRTYAEGAKAFRETVVSSFRLTCVFALPVAVGGTILAGPIINLLFGPQYANSTAALQILSWSAALVILRGTFRQALNAADRQKLDLFCAGVATSLNVGLNLILIPRYGIFGAATATLASEVVWLALASYCFCRHVVSFNLIRPLLEPVMAAIAMGICFLIAYRLFWVVQGLVCLLVYFGVLLLLGQTEVRALMRTVRPRVSKEAGQTTNF